MAPRSSSQLQSRTTLRLMLLRAAGIRCAAVILLRCAMCCAFGTLQHDLPLNGCECPYPLLVSSTNLQDFPLL